MSFSKGFMDDVAEIATLIDYEIIDDMATIMNRRLQEHNGRLFILGIGGSNGNATHSVNDFKKLCKIESHTPFDNSSEMTARINDDGWDNCLVGWIQTYKMRSNDIVLILSVGGGNIEKNISVNLVKAIQHIQGMSDSIFGRPYVIGIVGKSNGFTSIWADICLVIPQVDAEMITPYSESFQSVVLHLLASHPKLKKHETKWESIE